MLVAKIETISVLLQRILGLVCKRPFKLLYSLSEIYYHFSASALQGQLFQLMQRLENTTPHFIRCIKPNNSQLPSIYEQALVLQQLRCCGVLEVVRISRSGYPTRMSHQKFAKR